MGFKKSSLKEQKYSQKIIPAFLTIISLFFVGITGLISYSYVSHLEIHLPNFLSLGGGTGSTTPEKTNILVIGRGGGNHDAPNLTDSIILASVERDSNIVSLLSIPRDLYVQYPTGSKGKINEIYRKYKETYKLSDQEAATKLGEKIQEITGEKIDFYVNIDFEGFKKVIDLVGGVEVTLEENLVDYEYPTANGGYTTFILKKGTWTIDGETALKFARSRHSTSDFDRSVRQQQIISSLKQKITTEGYLSSPSKIKKMYTLLSEYIQTNMDISTILQLAKQGKEENKIISFHLNNSCFYGSPVCERGGFLYTPERSNFGGASVLIPNTSDTKNIDQYDEIKKFSNIIFHHRKMFEEDMKINVFNGTKQGNIAKSFAQELVQYGFNVPSKGSVGNTNGQLYEKTTIYYRSSETEIPETIEALKLFLDAELQKKESAVYSKEIDTSIEIILGNDFINIPQTKETPKNPL